MDESTVHELKIWKQYFDDVESGRKPFEVRKLDRLFGVGHVLHLREWGPIDGYSGRETKKIITYVMNGGKWGLLEGNCILGIAPITTRLAALDDGDEPKIVCLCGSVRFAEWFHKYEFNLSVEGVIVLAPCAYNNDVQVSNPDAKKAFDKLHMAKIDMCNEVIVLNIGGYIGESTRNEINYAIKTGKPIKYHEPT